MADVSSASRAGIPTLELDPFDEEILADPYRFYGHLRDLGPIFWVEKYGHYGTARHSEVNAILKNWPQFISSRGMGMSDITRPDAWREKGLLVEEDPPVHTDLRKSLLKVMTAQRLLAWRSTLLEVADCVVGEALAKGKVDAVPDLAERYVLTAFPKFLGVEADWDALIAVGAWNLNTLGPNNRVTRDSAARAALFKDWLEISSSPESQQAGGLGDDFYKAEKDGVIAPGMAHQVVRTLLRAGTESTIAAIGTVLLHFARNPEQYDHVRDNPKLVSRAFEESLRLETPTQTYFRVTAEGAEVAGVPLEAGRKIQIWLGSANRDPDVWSDADSFQVNRPQSNSLAFGSGVHTCFGAPIARLEGESFIAAFIKRVRRIELTDDAVFRLANTTRTLDALPVRLIA